MKIKGLKFSYNWFENSDSWWPDENSTTRDHFESEIRKGLVFYCPSRHVVISVSCWYREDNNGQDERLLQRKDVWMKSHPDTRPLTREEADRLLLELDKRQERKVQNKKNREFKYWATGDAVSRDILTFQSYLSGATSGGYQPHIEGDTLINWHSMLMKRIGPDEYLLGRALSATGTTSPCAAGRILGLLTLEQGLTLWPSSLIYVSQGIKHFRPQDHVLTHCVRNLTACTLSYPTARQKDAYLRTKRAAELLYKRARERWSGELDAEQVDKVERMLSIFGDKKEMKAFAVSLRMQYEMSKQ